MSERPTDRDDYELGAATRTATHIVTQTRDSHGDAYQNHKQIAALWTAFLDPLLADDEEITAWMAATMMQQVKQSRMMAGTLTFDHFADVAGYADVGLDCAVRDPDVEVEFDG